MNYANEAHLPFPCDDTGCPKESCHFFTLIACTSSFTFPLIYCLIFFLMCIRKFSVCV